MPLPAAELPVIDATDPTPSDPADPTPSDPADPSDPVDLEVAALDAEDAPTVVQLVAEAEQQLGGVPLLDEAEQLRLERFAADGSRPLGWTPLVAHLGEDGAGYAAVVVADGHATGDAAVAAELTPRAEVLTALLAAAARTSAEQGADRLQVWIRAAADPELAAADAAGFTVDRRLGVLGGPLPVERSAAAATPPDGITIRAARPDVDDDGIVAVLAGAYGDGPDGGWDLDRFRERRQLDWFRYDDLLVAEGHAPQDATTRGRILGIHWLKRRSPTVGEVHNLAVHPDAQGRRLGPALLHAGLDHLTAIGCEEVLLWVDRVNDRAVRLYTSQGLTTRWDDLALGRDLTREAGTAAGRP